MIEINYIKQLVNDFFSDSDIFVVEVKISDLSNIEIFLDSDSAVTIDDCAALSRHIESIIDSEDEDCNLMVSSAGITSPLLILRQYKKNIGKELVITLIDNKITNGILKEVSDSGIIITKQTLSNVKKGMTPKVKAAENITISFSEIKKAKLFFEFK